MSVIARDQAIYECACGIEDANRVKAWCAECGILRVPIEGPFVYADQLQGAVSLLDALDRYVGHVNCGVVHGAPECSCGFDELYARVRAVVRDSTAVAAGPPPS